MKRKSNYPFIKKLIFLKLTLINLLSFNYALFFTIFIIILFSLYSLSLYTTFIYCYMKRNFWALYEKYLTYSVISNWMMYKSFLTQDYIQRIYSKSKIKKRENSRENCGNAGMLFAATLLYIIYICHIIFCSLIMDNSIFFKKKTIN